MTSDTPEPRKVHVRSSEEREARAKLRAKRKAMTQEQADQAAAEIRAREAEASDGKKKKKKQQRGQVCPKCGKFYDVTDRPVGTEVTCYCGHTFTVSPPTDKLPEFEPVELTQMKSRKMWVTIGLVASALVGIGIMVAAILRLRTYGFTGGSVFSLLLALLFLVAAVAIGAERKRIQGELDEMEG